MFVLDTSVAAAWFFPNEVTDYTERILDQVQQTGAVVPTIWPLEIANVLLVGERRRRLTEAQAEHLVAFLQDLPIRIAESGSMAALRATLALGRPQGLSTYDASYLELAMREGLPLATQDARLRAAAQRVGIELV